ncbi:hypothetical protein HPC49_13410 [Pyxidicoccus fallax]|uniref:Uncharacterized protein n=1 Tax=Pyxidicoccus fallax TaxID=394095 RepID=A0A848LDZ7_9BACT|nr:hypothetical protein [Pyxidicoccus fallax]NMO16666.1 hypothetical protein [Pyxidicoccus fallax]NPC79231.1 hypothetical protein [Pyxidicoccus fallax]
MRSFHSVVGSVVAASFGWACGGAAVASDAEAVGARPEAVRAIAQEAALTGTCLATASGFDNAVPEDLVHAVAASYVSDYRIAVPGAIELTWAYGAVAHIPARAIMELTSPDGSQGCEVPEVSFGDSDNPNDTFPANAEFKAAQRLYNAMTRAQQTLLGPGWTRRSSPQGLVKCERLVAQDYDEFRCTFSRARSTTPGFRPCR